MGAEWRCMQGTHASCCLLMVALIAMAYCMEPVSCKAAVIITNGMMESLTVHCHSADNDLGVHILGTNAPPYVFEFNENLWGTTLWLWSSWEAGALDHRLGSLLLFSSLWLLALPLGCVEHRLLCWRHVISGLVICGGHRISGAWKGELQFCSYQDF